MLSSLHCTYLNDVLQKGLVGRHFGLFHHGYVLPHPGDEHKFGTFTHFITSLKEKTGIINNLKNSIYTLVSNLAAPIVYIAAPVSTKAKLL